MGVREPYDRGQFIKSEQEITLEAKYNTEELTKSGHHLYKRRRVFDRKTTSDSYEDSLIFDARFYKQGLIHVLNKHASNAIKLKVLACINPLDSAGASDWSTLEEAGVSEFTVNAGADKVLSFTVAWAFVKVQVKASTAGSQGVVNAYIAGKSP